MFSERSIFFILLGVLVVAGLGGAIVQTVKQQQMGHSSVVNSFEECVAQNGIVRESYPIVCATRDGKTFAQDIGNELAKREMIHVAVPRPNEVMKSPISIFGEARGYWFFEGSFLAVLEDDAGNVIASGIAIAQGDWMTENFVPFSAEVRFDAKGAKSGFVIMKKDNPSGLPEHDDELRIPVRFE